MSAVPKGKLPLPELAAMKRRGDKIVMVTAYDAPGARFAEDAGVDAILVGDTAAMVVLGYEGTTVPVTMDEMVFLARTVARAARRPIVIGDMPFGSYQVSDEDAVRNAIRFFKEARTDAVKLEGAGPVAVARPRDRRRWHPGHGPHRADAAVGHDARRLQDAGEDGRGRATPGGRRARLEEAGCFSVVLEAVPAPVAAEITHAAPGPDDRDWRGTRLRRPGARLSRPARAHRRAPPPLRQALRRPLARDP